MVSNELWKVLCMLFLLYLHSSAHAFSQTTDSIRTIGETVIEARTQRSLVASPDAVSRMDRAMIEQLGLMGVSDVIRRFPGVTIRDYGGIGGMKTVSVRNVGTHHTAVSYDDIVVTNTQAGQIDLSRFSTNHIGEVSVANSQGTSALPSARHLSSAAIVEIKPQSDTSVGIHYGSFGYMSADAALKGNRNGLTGDGVLQYTRADGDYPFTIKNGSQTEKHKRIGSDVESLKAELHGEKSYADGTTLTARTSLYISDRHLPGGVIYYVENAHEQLKDRHFFIQSAFNKPFNNKWQLTARAKYSNSWNRYDDTDVKYTNGCRTDIFRQQEYYTSLSAQWKTNAWLTFNAAEDFAVGTLTSNLDEHPDPTRLSSQSAIRAIVSTERLDIDAYMSYEYYHELSKSVESTKTSSKSFNNSLSPSIGFSYKLSNDEQLYLRARYKTSFRMPTFSDMYYLHIGNTNLKPENARQISGGLAWQHNFGNSITSSLTCDAYFNEVKDKIVAFPTTYVWKMRNIGKVHIKGIDVSAEVAWRMNEEMHLQMNGAYTFQECVDKSAPKESNLKIPLSPRHSGTLSTAFNTPWLTASYEMIFCGSRYSAQQNKKENLMEAYAEHNISLSRSLKLRKYRMRLALSAINIFNKQYEIVKFYPMPGRQFRLSFTLKQKD